MKIRLRELRSIIRRVISEEAMGEPSAERAASEINAKLGELQGDDDAKKMLRQALINIGLSTGFKSIVNAEFVKGSIEGVKSQQKTIDDKKKKAEAEKNRRALLMSPSSEKQTTPDRPARKD